MIKTTSPKQGLSGALTVLRHEDQDEFDLLLARFREEFAPANQHESFLVEQMAQSRWRLSRASRLETAILDRMIESELEGDRDIVAQLFAGADRTLANIQRYAAAAERSYYRAHTELLRSRRIQNEANSAATRRNTKPAPPKLQNEPNPPAPPIQNEPNLTLRL
jgi:hypothetical protein